MNDERFFDRLYDLHDTGDVQHHYHRFAESYNDELTSKGYAQPARVAAAVAASGLSPDVRILDAGCGTGLSGVALAERGFADLCGCDYSPEMLALAAETGVYRALHNIDLNAPTVEIPGAPFDVVTAVGIIGAGHVAGSAVMRLVKQLVPGGLFVVGVNEASWPDGEGKPALDELVADGIVADYEAELGDHIPGLGSRGWVITAHRT